MRPSDAEIRDALYEMALRRAPKSLCPSEVARALAVDWRALMPEVRRVAAGVPQIIALQKGRPVDPLGARGPIRLALKPQETD